jgi:dihydrolipoamide dehydrogenase
MTTSVVIIGAGPGGYVAAIRAAQLGLNVTLVEQGALGGVCLNWGCIPSKALLHVGHLMQWCQAASAMGLHIEGLRLDWTQTQQWKNQLITKLTQGIGQLLRAHNVTVVKGQACFTSPHTVHVQHPHTSQQEDGEISQLTADAFIIATGSSTAPVPGIDVDGQWVWDARDALSCAEVPQSLVILGAGVIGLEMAVMFQQLGTSITLVETQPTLLPGWDADVTKALTRYLKKHHVNVLMGTGLDWLERQESGITVGLSNGLTLKAQALLVAAGRVPNSSLLGLPAAGVATNDRGFITVDSQCRTNVPHIFAIGDVASTPLLAHKASKEGTVAAEVIAGKPSGLDYMAMPAVIFTQPELACVGLTAEKAHALGYMVKTGAFPLQASGRALIEQAPAGSVVKVVADATTDRVLGVHIAGPHAADMIAEATLAIEMGATVTDLALTVHAHPTLPESLMEAAEAVHGMAIHVFK